jgi:hypothetical protein
MDKRMLWSRILCVAGIAVTALGLQLDGRSIYVLCLVSAIGLVALSAFLGNMRHRTLVYGALALGVVSVAARIAYSAWLARHGHVEPGGGSFQLGLPLISYIGSLGNLGPWATLIGATVVLLESLRASMPALGAVSMDVRRWRRSRTVSRVGLAMMAIPVVVFVVEFTFPRLDTSIPPLLPELNLLIFPGAGLVARGAFLGNSRYRKLLYGAFGLTMCGLITGLNILRTDYFGSGPWWVFVGCLELAFPIGWVMSCVGAVYVIVESFRSPPVPKDDVERNTSYLSS